MKKETKKKIAIGSGLVIGSLITVSGIGLLMYQIGFTEGATKAILSGLEETYVDSETVLNFAKELIDSLPSNEREKAIKYGEKGIKLMKEGKFFC